MLNINKTRDVGKLCVALEGRLDTTTAPELEASLKEDLDTVTELIIDLAKLEYWTAADGQINAKSLHTHGSPEEGLAIASDGRVAYTGERAEEQTVAQASDGRVAYTGEQTTEQAEEQTTAQASDGRVAYTGEQTAEAEESHETAEEQAEEAPAAEETFDEIG